MNYVVEVFVALSVEEETFRREGQTAPVDHVKLVEDGIKNAAWKPPEVGLLVSRSRFCVILK
jgi:hypothetical protein